MSEAVGANPWLRRGIESPGSVVESRLKGLSKNAKSTPFDSAQDVLREPQHERYKSYWIQNDMHSSVRPEEPPSSGGVSKGCSGKIRHSLKAAATEQSLSPVHRASFHSAGCFSARRRTFPRRPA